MRHHLFIITFYAIALYVISPPSFSAYTTMTIEGVKQANGVWTAAGVMDTQGFVRTTGAVSVLNTTRNLPVAASVDVAASGLIAKSAARLAGPAALALAAYDVYQLFTDSGLQGDSKDQWVFNTGTLPVPNYLGVCYGGSLSVGSKFDITYSECLDYLSENMCLNGYVNCSSTPLPYSPTNSNHNWPIKVTYCNKKTPPTCNSSSTPSFYYSKTSGPIVTSRPATDSDFLKIPNLTIPQIISLWASLPSLLGKPYPITGTNFTPYSEWLGDPYFKDGNWWRDRMDISPSGTKISPTRVSVDIGPQKLEGQTDPNTTPTDTPATGTTPKEQTDFCKKNPQSIACQELGELEQEPFDPIEKPFHITPQNPWGSGDAQCPAPKVMSLSTGSTVTLSYQPACDFFRGVRPAVLALAFLAALYIALGIPVGKGD